jgi:hypothetical protein
MPKVVRSMRSRTPAGLHAGDALVLAERDGHVVGGAEADGLARPVTAAGELGEADLEALRRG